jgi:hypothetical protein
VSSSCWDTESESFVVEAGVSEGGARAVRGGELAPGSWGCVLGMIEE